MSVGRIKVMSITFTKISKSWCARRKFSDTGSFCCAIFIVNHQEVCWSYTGNLFHVSEVALLMKWEGSRDSYELLRQQVGRLCAVSRPTFSTASEGKAARHAP